MSNLSNPTIRPDSPPPILQAPKVVVQAPDTTSNNIGDIPELEMGGIKLEECTTDTAQNSARTYVTDSTFNERIGVTNIKINADNDINDGIDNNDDICDDLTLHDDLNYKNRNNLSSKESKRDIRDRKRFPTNYVSPDSLHMSTKSVYPYGGFGNDLNSKSRDPNSILLERLRRRKGDTGHLIPLLSGSAAPTHKLSSKILREHKIQKLKSKPVDPLMVKQENKNELVDVKPNNIIYGFNNNTVHDVVSGTDDINYLYNNMNNRRIKSDPGPQSQGQEDNARLQLKLARQRRDYHNKTLSQFKDEKMVIKSIVNELRQTNYDHTCSKVELEKRSKVFRATIKNRLKEKKDPNVAKIMHAITPDFVYAIVSQWDSRTPLDISTIDRILDSLYNACVSSGYIGIQDVRPLSLEKKKEQQIHSPSTPIGAGNIQEVSIDPALLLLDERTALLKSLNNDDFNRTASGKKISNTINESGEMTLCCQMPSFGIRTKQVYKSLSMVNPWSSRDIALARAIKPIGMDNKVLRTRPPGISNAYLVTKLNHPNALLKRSTKPTEIIDPEGLRQENLLQELSSPVKKNQYLEYIRRIFLENVHEPTVTEETTESLNILAESKGNFEIDSNNTYKNRSRASSPSKDRLMMELRTLSPTIGMNQSPLHMKNSNINSNSNSHNNSAVISVSMGHEGYSNSYLNNFHNVNKIQEVNPLLSPMNDSPDKTRMQILQRDDDTISLDLFSTIDRDDYGFSSKKGGVGSSRGVLNRSKSKQDMNNIINTNNSTFYSPSSPSSPVSLAAASMNDNELTTASLAAGSVETVILPSPAPMIETEWNIHV